MEITAAMVKALRDRTGLSMMECKGALVESGGDPEKAIDILRKKGAGKIEKLAGREAGQGRIACVIDLANRRGGIVEMRCETAPVAKTDDFIALANQVAKHTAAAEAPTAANLLSLRLLDDAKRTLGDYFTEVVNRLHENIQIARVAKMNGHLASYIHHDSQKGCLVEFSEAAPKETASGVCMHVTAARPTAVRREDIDAALVEKERAFAREEVMGKPANIVDKIVDGKMNKWFAGIVLPEQAYVLDDKKSVAQALKDVSPTLTIRQFVRYQVGES